MHPDGDSLLRTEHWDCSLDGVMELTTRLEVFAQPSRHRYCPVTVPDEAIRDSKPAVRPVHVGVAASQAALGWWLARDVVTERSAIVALTHARRASTDLPLT